MNNLINISDTHVSINDYPLQVVEYKGERVVSSYDISKLHNKPVKRVNEQFERNKERLKEGVDYFLVDKGEFSESLSATQTFIPNNVKDIKLFTERGYLKLVKSFTDDLSWQVQDLLVDSYFKLKEMLTSKDALLLGIIKAEGEAATAEAIRRYEAEHVLPLEKYKKEAVPKVNFYNIAVASSSTVDIGEAAKILKYKATGRNNLFKFLRREGVLMKNNAPKQEYVNKGWWRGKLSQFKLVEYKVNEEVKIKTLVPLSALPNRKSGMSLFRGDYQKGLDGIRKMLDEAGLLPEAR